MGLYLQDQYRFSHKLEMTLGLRHDDYSDFGGNTSARAAWVYGSDFDASFKLIYGEAFRAPSLRQTGSTVVGNPDLKAEEVVTLELVWIQAFKHGQTGLTYFHSNYQNKITTILRPASAPPGGPRIFVNSGDITASGFELDALENRNSPIRICILGEDPFGTMLDTLKKKKSRGRELIIERVTDFRRLSHCHLVFISASEKGQVNEILHHLKATSVLTVGDMKSFVRRGGIIAFVMKRNKIRIEINLRAAKRAGLKISAKLLEIAKIVKYPPLLRGGRGD